MPKFDVSVSLGSEGYRTDVTTRGHVDHADLDAKSGGIGAYATPEETVLGALGSCTAMTLTLYARRKGWALTHVDVKVTLGEEGLQRAVTVTGDLQPDQVERLLEMAYKCPVHKMLTTPPAMTSTIARA